MIKFLLLIFIASSVAAQGCISTPSLCSSLQCCSQYGYCGTTSDYCAPGNCVGNCWTGCKVGGSSSCPSGQCCSQYGYCGTTADYCSPSNLCFSGCWSSPSGPSSPPLSHVFVGYIPSWITERPAPCTLSLSSLDVTKYTHLNIAFAGFDSTNFVLSAMNNDDNSGWYSSVVALKSRNSSLKVMISVGGGGFGTAAWTAMASTATNRGKFIANAISFARSHNFDGIDLDWEFPDSSQTSQIQALFSSLRSAITADASSSGKPALLLTLAAPNYQSAINAFGFSSIQGYVDWINVMNYDYYGPWSSTIGSDTGYNSVVATFSYFPGVPTTKLVMGFANYARGFTLSSTSKTTPGSLFSGPGQPGSCSKDSEGTLTYTEVSAALNANPKPTVAYDSAAQTPYFYQGNQWVSYDDIASIKVKVDYLINSGLRGGMVWTVDSNHTLTDYIASRLGT